MKRDLDKVTTDTAWKLDSTQTFASQHKSDR